MNCPAVGASRVAGKQGAIHPRRPVTAGVARRLANADFGRAVNGEPRPVLRFVVQHRRVGGVEIDGKGIDSASATGGCQCERCDGVFG